MDKNSDIPYLKTIPGLISGIYSRQKESSKKRKHLPPTYTRKQLSEWLLNQKLFHYIYNNWVASEYEKMMVPSVDRLDDYKGYSLNNIRITTWSENMKKGHRDKRNGINRKQLKAIVQYDTNGKFINNHYSIMEAGRRLKISPSGISQCCLGNKQSFYGFIWKYNEPKGFDEAIKEMELIDNIKNITR